MRKLLSMEQEVLDTEPTVEEAEPSTIENEFDTEISSKISKYAEVIGYYDKIIAANGSINDHKPSRYIY